MESFVVRKLKGRRTRAGKRYRKKEKRSWKQKRKLIC